MKQFLLVIFLLIQSSKALAQSCYQDITTEQFKELGTQLSECFDEADFSLEGEEDEAFCNCEKNSSSILKKTSDYDLVKKDSTKNIVGKSLLRQGQNEIGQFLINLSVLENTVDFKEIGQFSCEFAKYIEFPKGCEPDWKDVNGFLAENVSTFLQTKYDEKPSVANKEDFLKKYNKLGENLLSKVGAFSGEKASGNQCIAPNLAGSIFFNKAELVYDSLADVLERNKKQIKEGLQNGVSFNDIIKVYQEQLLKEDKINDYILLQDLSMNPAFHSIVESETDFEAFINKDSRKKGLKFFIENHKHQLKGESGIANKTLHKMQMTCESGARKMASSLVEKFCQTNSDYKVWGEFSDYRIKNYNTQMDLGNIVGAELFCEQRAKQNMTVLNMSGQVQMENLEKTYLDSLEKMNSEDICKDLCVGGVAKAGCELKKVEDVTKILESSERCKGDKAKSDDYCLYIKSYTMAREQEATRLTISQGQEVVRPSIAATFLGKEVENKKPTIASKKETAKKALPTKTTASTTKSAPTRKVSSANTVAPPTSAAIATPNSEWTEMKNLWPGETAKNKRSNTDNARDLKREEENRKQMNKMADLATKAVEMASDMSKRRAEEIAEKGNTNSDASVFPANFSNDANPRNERRVNRLNNNQETASSDEVVSNDIAAQAAANAAAEEAARAASRSGRSPASVDAQSTTAKTEEAEVAGPQVVVVKVSDIKQLSAETLKEQGVTLERPFIINVVGNDGEILEVNVEQIQHEETTIFRPVVSVQNRSIYRDLLASPLFEGYREFTLQRDEERSLFHNILDTARD